MNLDLRVVVCGKMVGRELHVKFWGLRRGSGLRVCVRRAFTRAREAPQGEA